MGNYLTHKPVLQERHRQYFNTLDRYMVQRVLLRMEQDRVIERRPVLHPEEYTGDWLFEFCRSQGLDHATVVLPMCREGDDIGRILIERLIGKPIHVWRPPPQTERPRLKDGSLAVRPPSGTFTRDQVILTVIPNPKKAGSATWHRFAQYVPGRTVGELMERGVTRADILWDMDPGRKHIVLGSAAEWRESQESKKEEDNG